MTDSRLRVLLLAELSPYREPMRGVSVKELAKRLKDQMIPGSLPPSLQAASASIREELQAMQRDGLVHGRVVKAGGQVRWVFREC